MQELILGCGAFALVIGMIIWRVILRERLRTKKRARLAPGLGFSMVKEHTVYPVDTPLFHKGDRGSYRIQNGMEGVVAGMQTVLFDLHYEVDCGSEDGKASAWRTVATRSFRKCRGFRRRCFSTNCVRAARTGLSIACRSSLPVL